MDQLEPSKVQYAEISKICLLLYNRFCKQIFLLRYLSIFNKSFQSLTKAQKTRGFVDSFPLNSSREFFVISTRTHKSNLL